MARLAATATVLLALACSGSQPARDDVAKSEYHWRLAQNCYTQDRNLACTQRELYESLALDPNNADAHYLKGIVLMGLEDLVGSEAEFTEALRLRSDFLEARNNLGSALLAQGRYSEAIQVLTPLTETPLYPTPAFAHGNIGWAWYQLGDLAKARRAIEMALFLNPKFCLGANNLGLVYRDMGNARSAREQFEKATKQCPTFADAWYHLGVLLQEAGETKAADEAFGKCTEAGPDSPIGKRCAARR
jgi:type IV pilus assembly protein PilF